MRHLFCYACAFVLVPDAAVLAAEVVPIPTPYARQEPLAIRRVVMPASPARQYACIEMAVEVAATYANPFDSSDIAVDAQVALPNGKTRSVPGFFYRPFERKLDHGREVLTPNAEPGWRVRWTPPLSGAYTVVVTVRDRTGERRSEPVSFTAEAGEDPGFVRISPRDRRYFEFDNGRAFFPIGLNMCWPGQQAKTFDYDAWIPAFAQAGCTATRLWLAPDWNPLAPERTGKREDGLGMGQFDLAAAWRLDHVLEQARREGLYVKLCLDSFNILRRETCYPHWEKTPHNAANGGPLAHAAEFWTSPAMDRLYRDKLRYLVARYGAMTHVLAWEFWNEVDIISDYQTSRVRDWHVRMARYLRSIDPDRHLITTSFANSRGDPAIDGLAEMDYVQTHRYGGVDPVAALAEYQASKEAFGKPHYVGEFGADSTGGRFADDSEGVQIHDPLWISAACGASGGAQPWYWEAIHASHMHGLYAGFARFVAGIDWPAEQMRRVTPRLAWQRPPVPLPRKELVLETSPASWSPSEFNRPRTVRIDRTGVRGEAPLAGIQHGMGGHKDKHNPVRLEIDLPWASRFGVLVQGVSGWGGAALEIRLDGQVALKKKFADAGPPENHETLREYNGWYEVDVPAGKHVVEVENLGPDWFLCGYRLHDGPECRVPPLLAWATAGRTTTLAWVRLEARSWTRVCAVKESLAPSPPSVLTIPQLAPGTWKAEVWDTWPGRIVQELTVKVGADGEARVPLPEIAKDLAVRLRASSPLRACKTTSGANLLKPRRLPPWLQ